MVGTVHLATAEVVVVEERLAVRITEFDTHRRAKVGLADDVANPVTTPNQRAMPVVQGLVSAFDTVVGAMIVEGASTRWRSVKGPFATAQEDWLWWATTFSVFPAPALWLGATHTSWKTLGNSVLSGLGVEHASVEDVEATCLNVVTQSFVALAQTLTTHFNMEVTSGDAVPSSVPDGGHAITLAVQLAGALTEIPLVAVFDKEFLALRPGLLDGTVPSGPPDRPALPPRIATLALSVNVILGRTTMLLGELFKLTVGSVVEFAQPIAEPVKLLVNNRVIALGQVVLCGHSYGVRIVSMGSDSLAGREHR